MEIQKLEASAGENFNNVVLKAQRLASINNNIVEFEFNGVKCLVNSDTNVDLLWRDYQNSWTMGWKKVGPGCDEEYCKNTKSELKARKAKQKKEQQEREEKLRQKDEKELLVFKEKTAHVKMEFKSKSDWDIGRSKNKDHYGNCCYEYAEGWAKLMQVEIMNGKKLEDIAEKCSHELSFMGITGFMYGVAVQVLSHCWLYGEQLRKWHNKEYNYSGDGVVNPAVLTIKS